MPKISLPGSSAGRELLIAGAAIVFGLIGLPPLIYLAGSATLGRYAGGGVGALIERHFSALAAGAPSAWIVALAPYVLLILLRIALNRDGVLAMGGRHRDSLTGDHYKNTTGDIDDQSAARRKGGS